MLGMEASLPECHREQQEVHPHQQKQQQKEKNDADHHVLINKINILTYTLFFSLNIYMNIIYNGFKTAEQVGETEENEGS